MHLMMGQARNNNMLIKMLLSLLNLLNMIKIHYHFSFKPDQYHKNNNHTIDDHQLVQNNLVAAAAPSPWLVPLPVQCIAEFVKNRLPVVQYRDFLRIKTGQPEADEPSNNNMCIVCMNSMEGSQVVREPCNCSHAFHKECLDIWIDEGQLICPLCRSELVPNSTPKTKDHKEMGDFEEDDPWRAERMVYLFGEDHLMSYSIGRLDNPSLISFWMTKT